ncbi:hypothetical protein JX266_003423 [Neoarthrinium moseri]|uniref:uncharacterized protein n=1 Tax=Neoarthrinium moseri TaxID=1658444 RepID=UPI001FDE8D6A|nr:uncharacterized protein JN550_000668 [Neoarthrinium moseri]KAI1851348.1 hypothetical protein JX266_003423 [Neoarthrinium moseri]KAI1878486.1 hypothetical protein JN550_000668 [Neoarthrinium moseri]
MSASSQPPENPKSGSKWDLINRGSRTPSPLGTLTFVGLRLLDIPWQYHLLHNGAAERAISALRLPYTSYGPLATTGIALLDRIDLPLPRLILLAMATGSAAKQIFWQTCLSYEEFPPSAAVAVSAYNTLHNSLNSLLFVCAATSVQSSAPQISMFGSALPLPLLVGTLAYAAGITIETLSELQRLQFKQNPENTGKVCKTGLWGYARHINYFGYALWRGGYCMAASGWLAGLAMGIFLGWDLAARATTILDEYCTKKYGQQWAQFQKDVPYRIVPGIY